MIEYDVLKQLIKYVPETGKFYEWRQVTNELTEPEMKWVESKPVRSALGKKVIEVNSLVFEPDKLAFYYQTGRYPAVNKVIHLNGDVTDNRWSNLKLDGGFKYGDVYKDEAANKYVAFIKVNEVRAHLGMFYTKEAAEKELSRSLAKLALLNK
ncbi:hypothetical protein KEU06_15490 [Pseudaminobacter sp. 19-2017]|uniref:HNH nuclease domain-containing protein n=1 Tax=Pseudaminobacter soli (ex Zhang et al. 2022) TaxID=2831468 RepID=A0A942IA27_9HYPH|nr:hypothetical protein [Pseudaminobacter soli]MBS3650016.1 hypothetical protein [Pseudaminobacter soli]